MVRLINRDTGGDTWVHESRLEEYLALGHRLPEPPPAARGSDPTVPRTVGLPEQPKQPPKPPAAARKPKVKR